MLTVPLGVHFALLDRERQRPSCHRLLLGTVATVALSRSPLLYTFCLIRASTGGGLAASRGTAARWRSWHNRVTMSRRSRTQPRFMLSIPLGNLIQLGGLFGALGLVAQAARAHPPWGTRMLAAGWLITYFCNRSETFSTARIPRLPLWSVRARSVGARSIFALPPGRRHARRPKAR
jgi:hypothetical protein